MPKAATLLASILKSYGYDPADPQFADLLANQQDLPDKIEVDFSKYVTLESAKNNPVLKRHFTGLALNGVDNAIEGEMNAFQFPDEDQSEIKGIENTYEKIKLLTKKLQNLTERKQTSTSTKEKETINQQIADLNRQISDQKNTYESKIKDLESGFSAKTKELLLKHKIASQKLDTVKFDHGIMQTVAWQELNKALEEKGAKIVYNNDRLFLKQLKDESLDYYENNTPVEVDNFIERVLAEKKLLAVTDPSTAPGISGTTQYINSNPASPANGNVRPLNDMLSHIDRLTNNYQQKSAGR